VKEESTMKPKTLAVAVAAAAATFAAPLAQAQSNEKLKVGLMLPATGTFAALGTAINNGSRL